MFFQVATLRMKLWPPLRLTSWLRSPKWSIWLSLSPLWWTKHNKWNEKPPEQTNKPERKKIESIPVVPQSTKMTKKRNMDKNKKKTNYYWMLDYYYLSLKKMSFPVAHLYKQFLVRLIQRYSVLLCNLIWKKKLVFKIVC